MSKQTIINKISATKLKVEREFDAPVSQVWKAWTESELLDQWWAPKPWKAVTKSMDFREGGRWFYYMQGPNGEVSYNTVDYIKIVPQKTITWKDAFSDEKGNPTNEYPSMHWINEFTASGNGTKVTVDLTFTSEADMQKIVELGFKEGFTMGLDNLEELLKK